ncbi:hypothetical protein MJ579_01465 [Klebsiella pneumoniae]|nr:hypothetical protein MJ579_01465 [Klebsiella pneumoniae]
MPWHGRPTMVLNTWPTTLPGSIKQPSGLAILPTLIGSLVGDGRRLVRTAGRRR